MRTVFFFLDLVHLVPLFIHCFIGGGIVFFLVAGGHLPVSGYQREQLVLLGLAWTLPTVFLLGATSALAFYQLLDPRIGTGSRRRWIAVLFLSLGSLAPLHWAIRGRSLLARHSRGDRRPVPGTVRRAPARTAPRGVVPPCYQIPSRGIGAPTRVLRGTAR